MKSEFRSPAPLAGPLGSGGLFASILCILQYSVRRKCSEFDFWMCPGPDPRNINQILLSAPSSLGNSTPPTSLAGKFPFPQPSSLGNSPPEALLAEKFPSPSPPGWEFFSSNSFGWENSLPNPPGWEIPLPQPSWLGNSPPPTLLAGKFPSPSRPG